MVPKYLDDYFQMLDSQQIGSGLDRQGRIVLLRIETHATIAGRTDRVVNRTRLKTSSAVET